MTIIEAVKSFVETCPYLPELARVHIDHTGDKPSNYGVSSNGEDILTQYFDGTTLRRHAFALYAREYTTDDAERLENSGFLERFGGWLSRCTLLGMLPDLGEGRAADSMAVTSAMLYDVDESGQKGIYQIQFYLDYTQEVS